MVDYVFTADTLQNEAYAQTERLGIHSDTSHNDAVDAFRHAYASARVVKMYGEYTSENRGVSHEQGNWEEANRPLRYDGRYGGQTVDLEQMKKEITMDMYNNEVGRRYGVGNPNASQSELGDVIYQKGIKGNELIQSLDDPRVEKYENYYLKQIAEYKQYAAPTIATNASVQEIGNYTFAALLLDNDDAMHAALDKAFATDVAKDTMQNAQQAVVAYDNQQAQTQQMDNPARVMRM